MLVQYDVWPRQRGVGAERHGYKVKLVACHRTNTRNLGLNPILLGMGTVHADSPFTKENSMKLILVRPPGTLGVIARQSTQHPVNLATLAAVVKRAGHEVRILDYEIELLDEDGFAAYLRDYVPDVVGVSCMTATVNTGHHIATIVKKVSPTTITMIGGPHCSALPETTLREFPDFDIAVYGEGEETLVELLQRFSEGGTPTGIPGAVHRQGDRVVVEPPRPLMPDLDTLPIPARDLLPLHRYPRTSSTPGIYSKKYNPTQLFTTRGCYAQCIFCASNVLFGRRVRYRSAQHVLAEAQDCVERFGFNHLTIDDDTFATNKKRLAMLCEGFSRLGVTWDCDTRVDAVSRDTLKMMAESGCLKVAYGVESGCQRILDLIGKNITVEQIENAVRWSKEVGLLVQTQLMIGSHPSENRDEVYQTLKLVRKIKPHFISWAITVPYPGTQSYDLLTKKGYLDTLDWQQFKMYGVVPIWRTDHFTGAELVALQKEVLRKYYLRPSQILQLLRRVRSIDELRVYAGSMLDFLSFTRRR